MPIPKPSHSFRTLAGVPVHYAREPLAAYGTRGVPYRFHCTPAFEARLQAMFADLWRACPLGPAEVLTSAGAYVAKQGHHGLGTAFDLDGVFWSGHTFVAKNFLQHPQLYLAVESIVRKHFGTVLNYFYNAAHQDHLHVQDDGVPAKLDRSKRSQTNFIQAVARHVFDLPVHVVGSWNSGTQQALEAMQAELGVRADDTPARFARFLDAVAAKAFDTAVGSARPASVVHETIAPEAVPTVGETLARVYEVLDDELMETAARKRVETAITALADSADLASIAEMPARFDASGTRNHLPATGRKQEAGEFSIDVDLKATRSLLTAERIDAYFANQPVKKNRTLQGIGAAVIAAAQKYGINATYIVAHAIWESAWGNSRIAREKNNLFGWSAFDRSPYTSASGFPSREACIDFVMGRVNVLYLLPEGRYFARKACLGSRTKGYGMNVHYAFDNAWAKGIADVARRLERDA